MNPNVYFTATLLRSRAPQQGGLATSSSANHAHTLPRGEIQTELAQDQGHVLPISERDVLQRPLSPVVRNFIPTYRPTWWKPPRSEPKSIDLLRKLDWVVLFFTLELDGPMLGGGCVGFPKKSPVMSNSISQSCLASDHFPPKMTFKHGDCPTMFDYGRID